MITLGQQWTPSEDDQKITTTQDILDAHYEEAEALHRENAALRAAVAEAICHLSPDGCKAMNDAYKKAKGLEQ